MSDRTYTFYKVKGPEGFLKTHIKFGSIERSSIPEWRSFLKSESFEDEALAQLLCDWYAKGDEETRVVGFVATQIP